MTLELRSPAFAHHGGIPTRYACGGPCPPVWRHRYFHKLHALDKELRDPGRPTKSQLLAVMEGHILANVELIGTYQRQR